MQIICPHWTPSRRVIRLWLKRVDLIQHSTTLQNGVNSSCSSTRWHWVLNASKEIIPCSTHVNLLSLSVQKQIAKGSGLNSLRCPTYFVSYVSSDQYFRYPENCPTFSKYQLDNTYSVSLGTKQLCKKAAISVNKELTVPLILTFMLTRRSVPHRQAH